MIMRKKKSGNRKECGNEKIRREREKERKGMENMEKKKRDVFAF